MIVLIVTVITQQTVQLDQRLSDMTDIFDLVFARASLDHVNRFPMLGQWVLLHIRTYVLEAQNATPHKVLNLGLQRIAILHVMDGSTRMVDTMQFGLIPPLRDNRYSWWVSRSSQLPLYQRGI
jgi:hypothetical protein